MKIEIPRPKEIRIIEHPPRIVKAEPGDLLLILTKKIRKRGGPLTIGVLDNIKPWLVETNYKTSTSQIIFLKQAIYLGETIRPNSDKCFISKSLENVLVEPANISEYLRNVESLRDYAELVSQMNKPYDLRKTFLKYI